MILEGLSLSSELTSGPSIMETPTAIVFSHKEKNLQLKIQILTVFFTAEMSTSKLLTSENLKAFGYTIFVLAIVGATINIW